MIQSVKNKTPILKKKEKIKEKSLLKNAFINHKRLVNYFEIATYCRIKSFFFKIVINFTRKKKNIKLINCIIQKKKKHYKTCISLVCLFKKKKKILCNKKESKDKKYPLKCCQIQAASLSTMKSFWQDVLENDFMIAHYC